ncbi:2-oxo-4-hydroxy-4-carboxy-5-ureidoimidazoline decarboxylase [Aquibium sp. ELW1220]|uniref:2-oxo-4-hydroxy-4-carboxy-5-ureidoimidazoline decarboxylase n=1 Tax=Aquibium sp. ELW1220 TaxID=2976766 RepID=UPI0025AF9D7C|nr:2-oxo-4-hydroxy-4-carboxy-5-ureidoimidazoline decarboxylase [Aquibium sp. ELW1220]MDN2582106.1 2-oxo-4-hydroxy-4-carboxy-5-ureidoimidazoline decarboxylase [Aquibium sp. ELW1220]
MTAAIDILNAASRDQAIALMEPLVECSPWVVDLAVDARPFADEGALSAALVAAIVAAGAGRQRALFDAHPELAGREAAEGRMTEASTGEQHRLGLLSLRTADARRLADLNRRYRERFGHPFIVALHRFGDLPSLFEAFERRLAAAPSEEHAATLAEIASVIRARTARAFGPGSDVQAHPAAATLE